MFIKLFRQTESYYIVMAHNNNKFIGLFIFFKKGFDSISSTPKISCSLVN